MRIKPVVTEKALADSKDGKYTFLVPSKFGKWEIKRVISYLFGVHVRNVRTIAYKAYTKKNYMGRKVSVSARKKAIVTLAANESIDIFEEKKNKKSKK